MKKILSLLLLLSLIAPVLSYARDGEDDDEATSTNRNGRKELRLEHRENNILRLRERLASTTASTSVKRIEKINDKIAKQEDQLGKLKERLLNKELKVVEVLNKIADKISERIGILEARGQDMAAAKAKLALANTKLDEISPETAKLDILLATEMTDTNKDQLLTDIRASQEKIKGLAKEAHALLVETVKEIAKN